MTQQILFIIATSILITQLFEPTLWTINWLHNHISNKKNILLRLSCKLLTCGKCLSFWMSLVILQDFYLSVIICVATELIIRITIQNNG